MIAMQPPNNVPDASVQSAIAALLADNFGRRNWAHQGLLAVTRGLTVEEASWKPPDLAHTIWQQLNHIAHWRRHIVERLQGRHPRTNQAWPHGRRTAAALRQTMRDLTVLQRKLHAAVSRLDAAELSRQTRSRYSLAQLLLGDAAHLSYHIGQITLTRNLYRRRQRALVRRAGRAGS